MNKKYNKPEMAVISYASTDVTSIDLMRSAVITPTTKTTHTFDVYKLNS